MKFNFRNSAILLVSRSKEDARLISEGLKTFHLDKVKHAPDADTAYKTYQKEAIDLVITDIWDGIHDGIALTEKIRADKKKHHIPVLAIAGMKELFLADKIRKANITELLMRPYSVDDLAYKINYLLYNDPVKLEKENQKYISKGEDAAKSHGWPTEEASRTVTHLLLESYMKQHEITLSKLHLAKNATSKSIEEIRKTHDKVKSLDNQSITRFNDFEKMWSDIIDLFMSSGVSGEALDQIDEIISKMPKDIKAHYQELTQQDKSFLTLVESLNKEAYNKARKKVAALQEQPNPLNGKCSADYKGSITTDLHTEKKEQNVEFYFFNTPR
jgi:CheY-like chemotaxis protein